MAILRPFIRMARQYEDQATIYSFEIPSNSSHASQPNIPRSTLYEELRGKINHKKINLLANSHLCVPFLARVTGNAIIIAQTLLLVKKTADSSCTTPGLYFAPTICLMTIFVPGFVYTYITTVLRPINLYKVVVRLLTCMKSVTGQNRGRNITSPERFSGFIQAPPPPIPGTGGAQIPVVRLPSRLDFVRSHLTFVQPQYGTYFMSPFRRPKI